MPRLRLRLVGATIATVVLSTLVAPAVLSATAVTAQAHDCCPTTVRNDPAGDRSHHALPPCCSIGTASPPAPTTAQAPTRVESPLASITVVVPWAQLARPSSLTATTSSTAADPIPILLRTSALLI